MLQVGHVGYSVGSEEAVQVLEPEEYRLSVATDPEIVLVDEESLALRGVGLQSIMGGSSSYSLTVSDCLLVSEESLALQCLLMGGDHHRHSHSVTA